MKFVAKLILTIIFIPVFLIFLFTVNLRFQFLSPSFWENSFGSSDTYSKLSISINKSMESQTIAEGGRASDVKILTDLITPENLKDTINKNIYNVLQYANGKVDQMIVFIPVNKISKSLLSNNFSKMTEQMNLTDLLKKFNMRGISPAQIQMISSLGAGSWIFFISTASLTILLLYLLYLCVNSGKRLVAPGLALIISGLIVLLVTGAGTVIRINWAKDLAESDVLGDGLIGIIAPPIIQGVLTVWLPFAIVTIISGIILFFIRKPDNKLK